MYAIAIITGVCLISVIVSYVAFRRGYTRSADDYFVAGSSLEATIPELKRQWFGRREGLHLDAYMAVRAIDGWTVRLGR